MRQSWDEYFMSIAHLVKTRSTCLRRQVGAVAVTPEHRILGTGYNGPLPGVAHCDEVGCLRQQMNVPSGQRQEICRAQHAEANICNFAARCGTASWLRKPAWLCLSIVNCVRRLSRPEVENESFICVRYPAGSDKNGAGAACFAVPSGN